MFRLFLLTHFFLLNILACEGGYDSCKQKLIDSNSVIAKTIEIPIAKNQILIYSEKIPKQAILKSDPFLNLYLVEDKHGFEHPFTINVGYPSGIAAITKTSAKEGTIIKKQVGLTSLGEFDSNVTTPSILTNSCCSLEGIITPDGVIEKEYIERFLRVDDTSYADIGISVKETDTGVVVSAFNPFFANNPFNEGDCILEIDGKKVTQSAEFMRDVLFSKIGSSYKVQIQRDSKILTVDVVSQKREYVGVKKTHAIMKPEAKPIVKKANPLYVTKKDEQQSNKSSAHSWLDAEAKKYGLKLGDKLLQVNAKSVVSSKESMKNISDFKKGDILLFERDGFQFFVHIN